jgi:coenzyme F420 hydrogenase subunit beta
MCSNTASLLGTEYFLRNRGIEPSEVLDFKYRGKGWIGYISVTRRNGKQHLFPRQITKPFDQVLHSVSFHTGFAVRRCLVCCDHTAEFSDMSLGDPRLPELVRSERIGQSLVLTRNAVAESILGQAESQGFLRVVEQIDRDRFFVAQNISFKRGFNTHLRAHRFMGIPVPQYITPKLQSSKAFEAMRILSYLPCYLSERRSLWPLFLPYGYVIRYASRFLGYYRALKRRFGRVSPLAEAGNGP